MMLVARVLLCLNVSVGSLLGFLFKVQWEPELEPNKHCSQMAIKHTLTVFGYHWPLLDVHVVARQVQ